MLEAALSGRVGGTILERRFLSMAAGGSIFLRFFGSSCDLRQSVALLDVLLSR